MKKKVIILCLAAAVLAVIISALCLNRDSGVSGNTVFIDPGHGGNDVGAANGSRYEKDDNLRLALEVEKKLKKKGVKVILSRDGDEFVSLEDRCKKANRKRASLFVALHRNSAGASVSGVEIWVTQKRNRSDTALGNNILSRLNEAGIASDRGVRYGYPDGSGDYYINSHSDMPSCLVELGFITNDEDNRLFDKKLKDYAEAIAEGIVKTLKQ